MHLLLVVLITVTLYYELYVGSGVATIMLAQLKIPFPMFVYILAAGNLLGAFASLLAGLADRFGRANLVVCGLLVVGLIALFWVPNVTTGSNGDYPLEWYRSSKASSWWQRRR
jgi:MFS family permease